MPVIKSSSDCQDPNSKLSLEIKFLDTHTTENETWLNYTIIFHAGDKTTEFKSKNKKTQTYLGTIGEIGKFAFILEPVSELKTFSNDLLRFLDSPQTQFIFQPSDPSFELNIEKIKNPLSGDYDYKIFYWIDAGNTNQLEYSWDALGIRFLTSKERIRDFALELADLQLQH
jgi:hypothetical protein